MSGRSLFEDAQTCSRRSQDLLDRTLEAAAQLVSVTFAMHDLYFDSLIGPAPDIDGLLQGEVSYPGVEYQV